MKKKKETPIINKGGPIKNENSDKPGYPLYPPS
jgi:hypothetical protein